MNVKDKSVSSLDFLPTRQSLLSRLKDLEDHASWKDFFDTYWKLIFSIAKKSGLTDDEAQEVVQETIICVCNQIPDFKYDASKGSFKSWLKILTQWRIKDQLRKRLSEPETIRRSAKNSVCDDREELEAIGQDPELEAVWDREWERNIMDAALRRLKKKVDPNHYQAFELYALKEWPAGKTAKSLNISVTKVYMIKHRIARLLREETAQIHKNII